MSLFYCNIWVPTLEYDLDDVKHALNDRLEGKSDVSDDLSHWLLCVLAASSPHFRETIFRIEKNIFVERLSKLGASGLIQHLLSLSEKLQWHLGQDSLRGKERSLLTLILRVLETLKERADHAFSETHSGECRRSKLSLPFTFPLTLVASRSVQLCSGKAVVPCGQWRALLEDMFDHLVKWEVDTLSRFKHLLKVIFQEEDDRLRKLLDNCAIRLGGQSQSLLVNLDDIDEESRYYPPCMANLHQILRKTHRLSHDSRYQYTLFLKDVGLSLDKNIALWKEEYSRPCAGSSCTHSWEEKEVRITYQVKHLYGLVGNAAVKYSRGCDTFIDKLSTKMNGGCPFKHLTPDALRAAFPAQLRAAAEPILEICSQNEPRRACAKYLSLQRRIQGPGEILRPIKYYQLARAEARLFVSG